MYVVEPMSWKKERLSIDEEEQDIFEAANSNLENANTEQNTEELPNEPLAYLQGLNSGNLMQFSQQSVLRDMMLQDIKTQINALPKLENHNKGDYCLSLILEEPPRSHWMFSVPLNKLYIRMNKTFNIDVKFKIKMPFQPLNLRAFICFVKDVSEPVLRCQNHLSTDPIKDDMSKRSSLLRCANPNSTYFGTDQGKSIIERYSVLVPLNMSHSSHQGGGYVRQTLAFNFACQNSCFGRKETCLLFCLENVNGDILGQQVLYVKICSCPKRDRNEDERKLGSNKRKEASCASDDEEVDEERGKKTRRRTLQRDVKEENESNDSCDTQAFPSDWNVSRTDDGNYRLVMKCSKKDMLVESIEGMIEKTAAAMLRSPQNVKLRQHANHLLNLKKCALKLS
ncbi:cellular tumor antigen p53 [Drosophila nasuta]|uniref:cellular tumor antigen p53 n=1 Tax=Drosophila nasuta TaxID=42062 RepID=UPI00295EF2A7|nr:cellular tumor antigen p53 [Drosophila nasuta]